MNLNQLKAFYLTVKTGSITKAAQALSVTPPAISKSLNKLQEFYNINLIMPCGKGMTTTVFGDEIFEMAENIFDLERMLESRLGEQQKSVNSKINIAASQSFAAYYLPPILDYFARIYHKCDVQVEMKPTREVYSDVHHGIADIGIASYQLENCHVENQKGVQERLVAICTPNHPWAARSAIKAEMLRNQVLINHENGSFPCSKLLEIMNKLDIDHNQIKYIMTSNEAIKQMVMRGIGIALISEKAIQSEVASGKLVSLELEQIDTTRRFYICRHKNKYITEPMQILLKLLTKSL
jgi:DNA-binding transcriptional LysR family regulator